MRPFFPFALGAALVAAFFLPAAAQRLCLPRAAIAERLAVDWGEVPAARGLADGAVLEVFASPGGTWTMVVTTADGTACVLGAGEAWEMLPAPSDSDIPAGRQT